MVDLVLGSAWSSYDVEQPRGGLALSNVSCALINACILKVSFLGGMTTREFYERYASCCRPKAEEDHGHQPPNELRAVASQALCEKSFTCLLRNEFKHVKLGFESELKLCDACVGFGNRLAAGGSEVCACTAPCHQVLMLFSTLSTLCVVVSCAGRHQEAQAGMDRTSSAVHGRAAL